MRFFNTAGPVIPEDHYHIPPLDRFDLVEIMKLIDRKRYFVLHAPRQTGKTSTLLALQRKLNSEGQYSCCYVNVEVGQVARENVEKAMLAIMGKLVPETKTVLNDPFVENAWEDIFDKFGAHVVLANLLDQWSAASLKPLVLIIDEIDALVGATLVSVLRQLRSGYAHRPHRFPHSVILCGVRDVRDYRIYSSDDKSVVTGGSAFNVKAKSLRLGDFTEKDVTALLRQHTEETGQAFAKDAVAEIWRLTQGQPWLVNALADSACEHVDDHSVTIGFDRVTQAREELILDRETHLDQLVHKLNEDRVRSVIQPMLSGTAGEGDLPEDDIQYVRDLGLLRQKPPIAIANPIYQEVIPRALTYSIQQHITHEPFWYVLDGDLQLDKLLEGFQAFFRENSEHWLDRFSYREAGPQLLLQAFLQRIVNASGYIKREYSLGRGRTDLMIEWRKGDETVHHVIECKVLRGRLAGAVAKGLEQTRAYMNGCGAASAHLVVFDPDEKKSWDEKIFRREETEGGKPVTVWGM